MKRRLLVLATVAAALAAGVGAFAASADTPAYQGQIPGVPCELGASQQSYSAVGTQWNLNYNATLTCSSLAAQRNLAVYVLQKTSPSAPWSRIRYQHGKSPSDLTISGTQKVNAADYYWVIVTGSVGWSGAKFAETLTTSVDQPH